ncbi:hypothetical protein [Tumebacillus permanentifrigoris]|uniref:Uncharacterized protein n=1 Tax=Tumebacillus permanentifrigoris TaxID=378543 RepID=A0A316D789_9BACL|nr:hypothetical protein [Tumebacillus permanentifrigoris]PWK11326.1 hypothetical protein C7459_111121 [Tumebacillus permanentifrigoris]
MARDHDGIRSALQADFEASTDATFRLQDQRKWGTQQMENQDAVQRGLKAAKDAARDEDMQGKVEELANQMGINTNGNDDDGDGAPLAAKDGVRYDYDDRSDV